MSMGRLLDRSNQIVGRLYCRRLGKVMMVQREGEPSATLRQKRQTCDAMTGKGEGASGSFVEYVTR